MEERTDAAKEIVSFAKSLSIKNRKAIVDLVLNELNVPYQDIKLNDLMLNWEDVKKMKGNYIDFGSHSLSHSILTKLTEEEADIEIKDSKRIIEEKINSEVYFFTYPNGGVGDYDERIISLLKKNNFTAACTLVSGLNYVFSNPYTLKRFCMNSGMESDLLGRFSKSLFALELSGIVNLLKSNLTLKKWTQ